MKHNRPLNHGWLFGAMILVAAAGCRSPIGSKVPIDATAGMFDSAKIDYSVDVAQLGEPISVAHVEGRAVSYEAQPTVPMAGAAKGRLTIAYPHPQARPGYARCRVTLTSLPNASAVKSSAVERIAGMLPDVAAKRREQQMFEVWTLDIPKADFDQAVAMLGESGYFRSGASKGHGVKVATTIDGVDSERAWRQVPELDALMLRVRTEGRLEEYHRPVTMEQRGQADQFASVAAYRSQQPALPLDPTKVVQGATALVSAAAGYGMNHQELAQSPPAEPAPALNYAPGGPIGPIPMSRATNAAAYAGAPAYAGQQATVTAPAVAPGYSPAYATSAPSKVGNGVYGGGAFQAAAGTAPATTSPQQKTAWRWPWQAPPTVR
ncbi:MAG: hypothetical protein JSS27_18330 [Planctomycetes bacterium]|nr:hypothetical protein [Planctomycetota bacterium]